MTLDYDRLIRLRRQMTHSYTERDTILYALGVGAGIGAETATDFNYVYEGALRALPTMAVVLAAPGFWQKEPEFGLAWQRILHAEQSVDFLRPLPVAGTVRSTLAVEAIYDKGAAKGALLYSRRDLVDVVTGETLAIIRQGSFLRGNGGFGGSNEGAPQPHKLPEGRDPDVRIALPTRPEQALIYRLTGDYNPLHADPAVATAGGFPRPILHGLCTYGIAGRALILELCKGDETRLRRMDVRFASPVFPGETIVTEAWCEGPGRAGFRAKVAERDLVVVNNGYAEFD